VARGIRLSHSPGAAAAYLRANLDLDVRDVLPSIRVPTLVMYRSGVQISPVQQAARYLADRIPGARLVELAGADLPPQWGDQEKLFSELERFLSDVLEGKAAQPALHAFWRRFSSRTSSMPPAAQPSLAIGLGATS
jgi:pimeloyl-ACP methyl ester carboxylesterase